MSFGSRTADKQRRGKHDLKNVLASSMERRRRLTENRRLQRKVPTRISLADVTWQRIKYSAINNTAGVMTGCRKSDGGKIRDQNLSSKRVLSDGQQLLPSASHETSFIFHQRTRSFKIFSMVKMANHYTCVSREFLHILPPKTE